MQIDKPKALDAFNNYVENYNAKDEKVRLKIEHTYRVSELCKSIAESISLPPEDVDLAWLLGILHDVGRFEQLRQFGTFIDAQSIDHAAFGAQILFEQGKIRDYLIDDSEDELIKCAVTYHSAYRVPEDLDQRTAMYCDILRDADKIDILKVNVDFPLEEIYNVSTEELKSCVVTDEVMEAFYEEHAVLRTLKKTPVDNVVGHISLIYELIYPESVKQVVKQGYLNKLMDFRSDNEKTREQFEQIRSKMNKYIAQY